MKKGEIDPEDLIGCRIKTWWPADKKFYGGTIKSYDSLKKKHVILYDDGDVEILRLDKERWELLDKGRKSTKIKRSSLETFGRKHNGSPSKKKKVSDKQSPSKPVKPRKKYASKSDFHQEETKETFELSNHEETMTSEADEMNSGGSEKELTSGSDEITANGKKSNKKVRSVSRRKKLKKTKNFRNMEVSEVSDEDKQNYSERSSEDRESVPQYSSDERSADESTEALRENVDNEEEAESEEDQDNSDVGDSPGETEKSHIEPSSPDDVSIADISDDAPLSKWKRQTGKKTSRKM